MVCYFAGVSAGAAAGASAGVSAAAGAASVFAAGAAGAEVKSGALAGAACSVTSKREASLVAELEWSMKNTDKMLRTQITTANVHVAFSTKLFVLRTPIIWLELAKLEARPPPFDF